LPEITQADGIGKGFTALTPKLQPSAGTPGSQEVGASDIDVFGGQARVVKPDKIEYFPETMAV